MPMLWQLSISADFFADMYLSVRFIGHLPGIKIPVQGHRKIQEDIKTDTMRYRGITIRIVS